MYLAHLRRCLLAGDTEHSDYLLNWMAYVIQNPGRRSEVAVIMRGNEGTGKGVTAKHFGRLFGPHFVHLSQGHHLTGHFNSHLQACSFLYADEAFFAGDRSHEGVLKALITEDTLMIEPKGLNAYSAPNHLNIFMSSNNSWVIAAGADARRYFVLTVSDNRKQNVEYFTAIGRQMENGGRQALLHYLLHRDVSGFNVRAVPKPRHSPTRRRLAVAAWTNLLRSSRTTASCRNPRPAPLCNRDDGSHLSGMMGNTIRPPFLGRAARAESPHRARSAGGARPPQAAAGVDRAQQHRPEPHTPQPVLTLLDADRFTDQRARDPHQLAAPLISPLIRTRRTAVPLAYSGDRSRPLQQRGEGT